MGRHRWEQLELEHDIGDAEESDPQDQSDQERINSSRRDAARVDSSRGHWLRRNLTRSRSALISGSKKSPRNPERLDLTWRVKRSAILCLLVGVLLWIAFSLWLRPIPQTQELGSITREAPAATSPSSSALSLSDPSSSSSHPIGESPSPSGASSTPSESNHPEGQVTVSVQGLVKKPGLYTVASGERWGNVIERAGGILPEADIKTINLAELAQDGQQLYVPKVGEQPPIAAQDNESGTSLDDSSTSGATASDSAPSVSGTSPVTNTVINVNLASAQELEALPGVGPALSQRIVDFREQNGPFASMAELDAVSGIGPALIKKFEGLVGF